MSKALGLDLGTNSIGWAIVDEGKEKIINTGVYIFEQGVGVDKSGEYSKAATRTSFRSARRLKFRRKLRKYETLKVLINNKMCPLDLESLDKWIKYTKGFKKEFPMQKEFLDWLKIDETNNKNPYYFRKNAVEEKIDLSDLGRALYHMAQRRGFKSNRKDKALLDEVLEIKITLFDIFEKEDLSEEQKRVQILAICEDESENKNIEKLYSKINGILNDPSKKLEDIKELIIPRFEKGAVAGSIRTISEELKKEKKTLGQLLYDKIKKGERVRGQYTSRDEHYLSEFHKICETQQLSDTLKKELFNAIFYQRPLKSQKHLVGKCTLEPTKARCPVSHPNFEEFRMHQFINTIKYKNEEDEFVFLSKEQREAILPLFFRSKRNFKFEDIRAKLFGKKSDVVFNYKDYATVTGSIVSAKLKNIFGEDYKNFKKDYIDHKGNKKSVDIYDIWHVLFSFDDDEKLKAFAKEKLGLSDSLAIKFIRIPMDQGYSMLSLKAINKILPFLKQGYIYPTAVFLAKIPEIVGKENWEKDKNKIEQYIKNLPQEIEHDNFVKTIADELFHHLQKENKNVLVDHFSDKETIAEIIYKFTGKRKWDKKEDVAKNQILSEILTLINDKLQKNIPREKRSRIDDKIAEFIFNNYGLSWESALEKLYHPADIDFYKKAKISEDGKYYLDSPRIDSVKNPMAMRTLFQLRKLLNYLIKEEAIDSETVVRIEMANELNDSNRRAALAWHNREREKDNENYRKALEEKGIKPTKTDVLKYRLWKEQEEICLYTGKEIGFCDIWSNFPTVDIEHTIPRSLCFDDSQANKTLCCLDFNRNTKKQQLPTQLSNYEEILVRAKKCYSEEIEKLKKEIERQKKTGSYASKEDENKRIQKKRKLEIKLDYYKEKFRRFQMAEVQEGFKHSQLNDTRIITKNGLAYLKTVFTKVYPVKGETTALFRELWKVQGKTEKKDRSEHNHHAKDAIVIACTTKSKYEMVARILKDEHRGRNYFTFVNKPWSTFAEDVESSTKNIFIKYHRNDNAGKKTKKVLKKRGKIQKNKDGEKIYLQGDTARGSLHQDTFYGRIKDPESKEFICVIRKPVSEELVKGEKEISKIVDTKIRELFLEKFRESGSKGILEDGVFLEPKDKSKPSIRINKVRIKARLKNPIALKDQAFKSGKDYKNKILVGNDANYSVAIYKGIDSKGKEIADFECVNLLDVVIKKRNSEALYPETKTKKGVELYLSQVIKKGDMVLLYENSADELETLSKKELWNRYYKVVGLSLSGGFLQIKLKNAFSSEIWEYEPLKKFNEYQKNKLFLHSQIKCLVENEDFRVQPDGEIIFN